MTTSTVANKNTQKLQRAVVDGLEDVKAQNIVVFDTEHLSSLFERVIIASGTSNRQTKALAASVRDAVREAGFAKPRIEGEGNGEWIIVDCGQVVVHIMQPNFRQYYHLEELWGEKPVRLKLGAEKPALPVVAKKTAAPVASTLKRSNAAKAGVAEAFPSKAQVKKNEAAAKKAAAPRAPAAAKKPTAAAKTPVAAKAPIKKVVVKAPAPAAKKAAPARKTAAAKPAEKAVAKPAVKAAVKAAAKPAAKKTAAKSASVRKA